ncbi:MAG: hypothetical protein KAI40_05310 [Desulfobacterales bacterium]|nr:hypothetical protein [Desulfobacterales bacterium]
MKYLYSVLFILCFSINLHATERSYNNYLYSNLNFSFCYNITSYDPLEYLYYKGLSKTLNKYIIEKVQKRDFISNKFEIQTGCTIFGGHPSIEISRNRNGNFVFIHGDTNLSQLVRIINYFSSKDWASFCYDNEQVNPQVALNTFNEILNDRASKPGKDFFTDKKEIIWELGDYKIIYQNDDLYYQYKNTRLKYKLYYPLPVKLKDRYFFVTNDTIQVFENGKIMLENSIPGFDDIKPYRYSMKAYKDWVNLYYEDKPVLSYSFAKNRFYKINRNKKNKI